MSAISRTGDSNNDAFIQWFVAFAIIVPFCICIVYIGKAIKTVLSDLSVEKMKEKKMKLTKRTPITMVNLFDSAGDSTHVPTGELEGKMKLNVHETDVLGHEDTTVEMDCRIHTVRAMEGDFSMSIDDELSNARDESTAFDDEEESESVVVVFEDSDLLIATEALDNIQNQIDNHGNDSEEMEEKSQKKSELPEESHKTMENALGKEDKFEDEAIQGHAPGITGDLHDIKDETTG
eukprot:461350_1